MDKDIKDKLVDNAKNNMPDMWDKIESKLEDKKKRNNKKLIVAAASLAIVIAIGGVVSSINIQNNDNNIADSSKGNSDNVDGNLSENNKGEALLDSYFEANKVDILAELDLEKYLENKICIGGAIFNSYDSGPIDIKAESENIVYGKVTKVDSYVNDSDTIVSNITVEVINDYKNILKKGDSVVFGNTGGELTFGEFATQARPEIVSQMTNTESEKGGGYDLERDRDKVLVQLGRDGVPQYKEGEYVLVYLKAVNKEVIYSHKDEKYIQPPTFDYVALKKRYVNPNTEEVYEYSFDYENNKLLKEYVETLDDIENYYK